MIGTKFNSIKSNKNIHLGLEKYRTYLFGQKKRESQMKPIYTSMID